MTQVVGVGVRAVWLNHREVHGNLQAFIPLGGVASNLQKVANSSDGTSTHTTLSLICKLCLYRKRNERDVESWFIF